MVVLGVVERPGGGDLGRDLAVAGGGQRRLVALARRLDRGALLRRDVVVDRRSGTGCRRRCPGACPGSGRGPPRTCAGSRRARPWPGRRRPARPRCGRSAASRPPRRSGWACSRPRSRRRSCRRRGAARTGARRPRSSPGRRRAARIRSGNGGASGVPSTSWRSGTGIAVSRPGSARSGSIIFVFSRNRNIAPRSISEIARAVTARNVRVPAGAVLTLAVAPEPLHWRAPERWPSG